MEPSGRIKVQVDILTKWGNYHSNVKEFANESHFENWERWMAKNSESKIIGVKRLTDEG